MRHSLVSIVAKKFLRQKKRVEIIALIVSFLSMWMEIFPEIDPQLVMVKCTLRLMKSKIDDSKYYLPVNTVVKRTGIKELLMMKWET